MKFRSVLFSLLLVFCVAVHAVANKEEIYTDAQGVVPDRILNVAMNMSKDKDILPESVLERNADDDVVLIFGSLADTEKTTEVFWKHFQENMMRWGHSWYFYIDVSYHDWLEDHFVVTFHRYQLDNEGINESENESGGAHKHIPMEIYNLAKAFNYERLHDKYKVGKSRTGSSSMITFGGEGYDNTKPEEAFWSIFFEYISGWATEWVFFVEVEGHPSLEDYTHVVFRPVWVGEEG